VSGHVKFPKPQQIRMSPELAEGLAAFARAVNEAGRVAGARAAQVMSELAASVERAKADRRGTHENRPPTEVDGRQ
jgi:hypothetical protein